MPWIKIICGQLHINFVSFTSLIGPVLMQFVGDKVRVDNFINV